MKNILVLGAGKIGRAVSQLLNYCGDYNVLLADDKEIPAPNLTEDIETVALDINDKINLLNLLRARYAVVSALPYYLNHKVAEAAAEAGVHYFDPTEDVRTARAIAKIAKQSNRVFAPQCGLAPGFISIVANHLATHFEKPEDIKLRVGALPQYPDNALKYNLTWSTDGLINEYCNPCETIYDGERREVLPLESLEQFYFDGEVYEAFSTSGGIGSLCESMEGKVQSLSYKTIRYPGHRDMIKMMADDLNLCSRREIFKDVIEHGIPVTEQDVVVISVSVRGRRAGVYTQETYAKKIYGQQGDAPMSAIQLTTASAICAIVDLHANGELPEKGFPRQENVSFDSFISNRFGKVYA